MQSLEWNSVAWNNKIKIRSRSAMRREIYNLRCGIMLMRGARRNII